VGRFTSWFGSRSVTSFVERARQKMAAGKLDDAARVVQAGLEQFPDSNSLLDLELSLRRARAHKTMRRLEGRIQATGDPLAFEELVSLYLELQLPAEARRRAEAYCEAHPQRDTPHLMLGEMDLQAFLEELSARHGHAAHEHLLQAANLNAMALQPRLLLAELYFCVGADRSIARLLESLQQMAPETPAMTAAFEIMQSVADPEAEERVDGLFERIEVCGELVRDPDDWPLSSRSRRRAQVDEDRADPVVQGLVEEGVMDEVAILRRDGSLITHANALGVRGGGEEGGGTALQPGSPEARFIDVVRTVSRKVFPHAGEFDMGKFKRCTIQGAFGSVVVGRIGNVMVGVRTRWTAEPARTWERLAVELENVCGRAA
jgi:hypothetical protein